jgi:16S rRNA processing protein RimM
MADIERDDLILVGTVGRAHGVKGEVKVVPATDDPTRFSGFKKATSRAGRFERELTFTSVRIQTTGKGLTPIVKIDGVDSRESAEALRGAELYVPAELLPLEEGEFFLHDLIGMAVEDEDGSAIGSVRDVLDLPAASTMVVKREGSEDVMIPIIPEFIIDVEPERIIVRLVEGMLEE